MSLYAYGTIAFFSTMLMALGALGFLSSSEWPVGCVSGVLSDANGNLIAPHEPTDRIQIYDASHKFIRGWRVDSLGGFFKTRLTTDGNIEVFTVGGHKRFVYGLDGNVVISDTYEFEYDSIRPTSTLQVAFHTPVLLRPFADPHIATFLILLGAFGLWAARRPWARLRRLVPKGGQA